MQLTEQIPSDPLRMGAKNTTTSNHPRTPLTDYTCKLLNAVKLHKYGRPMGGIPVYIKKQIVKYIKRLNVDFSHGNTLKICKTYTNVDFDLIL